MRFKYRSTHLPTGTVSETEVEADSEADFCLYLNDWNRAGNGVYHYISVDHITPKSPLAHMFKETKIIQPAIRTPEELRNAGGYWVDYQK